MKQKKPFLTGDTEAYLITPNRKAGFKSTLTFSEFKTDSEFKIDIAFQGEFSSKQQDAARFVKMVFEQNGVRNAVEHIFRTRLDNWFDSRPPETRAIQELIDRKSSLEADLRETLGGYGIQTREVMLAPKPWIDDKEISLDESALRIQLDDVSDELSLIVSGILIPDSKNANYYTTRLKSNGAYGAGPSIRSNVLDAVRASVNRTRMQDWQDVNEDHIRTASDAANTEAARYGRKLRKDLRISTGKEVPQESTNFKFENEYALPHFRRSLSVSHTGDFLIIDAGLFERRRKATGIENFKAFVEAQVTAATERQINGLSYEEVIALFTDNGPMQESVQASVKKTVAKYGVECKSCQVIIQELPELWLIRGKRYAFLEMTSFDLQAKKQQVTVGFSGHLKLTDPLRFGNQISSGMETEEAIRTAIAERARFCVSSFMLQVKLDVYVTSDLAPGSNVHAQVPDEYRTEAFKPQLSTLKNRLKTMLMEEFGVELKDIEYEHGGDPVAERLRELIGQSYSIEVVENVKCVTDETIRSARLNFRFRIEEPSQRHAHVFNSRVLRGLDAQQNQLLEEVEEVTRSIMASLNYEALQMEPLQVVGNYIAKVVNAVVERNHGLIITIEPNTFRSNVLSIRPSLQTDKFLKIIEDLRNAANEELKLIDMAGPDAIDAMEEWEAKMNNADLLEEKHRARAESGLDAPQQKAVRIALEKSLDALESRTVDLDIDKDVRPRLVEHLRSIRGKLLPAPDESDSGEP